MLPSQLEITSKAHAQNSNCESLINITEQAKKKEQCFDAGGAAFCVNVSERYDFCGRRWVLVRAPYLRCLRCLRLRKQEHTKK